MGERKLMKHENKKYALLEDGMVECLYYSNGEARCFYQDEDGQWYLDHDVWRGNVVGLQRSKIVKFGSSEKNLLEEK